MICADDSPHADNCEWKMLSLPGCILTDWTWTVLHVFQAGEERFNLELKEDGSVWYDICTFSKPGHPLAVLCYPIARLQQKQFAKDSIAVMKNATKTQWLSAHWHVHTSVCNEVSIWSSALPFMSCWHCPCSCLRPIARRHKSFEIHG